MYSAGLPGGEKRFGPSLSTSSAEVIGGMVAPITIKAEVVASVGDGDSL